MWRPLSQLGRGARVRLPAVRARPLWGSCADAAQHRVWSFSQAAVMRPSLRWGVTRGLAGAGDGKDSKSPDDPRTQVASSSAVLQDSKPKTPSGTNAAEPAKEEAGGGAESPFTPFNLKTRHEDVDSDELSPEVQAMVDAIRQDYPARGGKRRALYLKRWKRKSRLIKDRNFKIKVQRYFAHQRTKVTEARKRKETLQLFEAVRGLKDHERDELQAIDALIEQREAGDWDVPRLLRVPIVEGEEDFKALPYWMRQPNSVVAKKEWVRHKGPAPRKVI